MPLPTVIARGDTGHGEVALRRRGEVLELIVDGVFAMDSAHTDTEVALAGLALDRLPRHQPDPPGHPSGRPHSPDHGWRVVIGGLGLGFTARAALADQRVVAVQVVELQSLLVDWAREGLVPPVAELLEDPRLRVEVGDVIDVVGRLPRGSVDAILLDVDNGPGFLVHEHNASVYRTPFLTSAIAALTAGGVVAVWSADPDPSLPVALHAAGGGEVDEVLLDVERDGRRFRYAVYLARSPRP